MSKSIGKLMGAGGAPTSMYASENAVLNYLKDYNTSNYDNTLNNLTSYASNASNQLNNMGNYNFSVEASDDARQRAEQATYQSYTDMLQPQFASQMSELHTSLANKGIPVGSQAYLSAMGSLNASHNATLRQAAQDSVSAGQEAYSNSLNDQIKAATFANSAQSDYINQLLQALQNSYSGYDIAMDKYNIQNKGETRIGENKAYNTAAQVQAGNDAIDITKSFFKS
ncbi:MAG: hypothetical protein IKA30_04940 [Alphaproteobacteria bacterium]|nr:hypothetical protein [Alphaproteobacteria bacterium]